MIEFKDVSYGYPKSGVPVLRNFSAEFFPAEITAITGPNGCGKTTVTKLIAGILRPLNGTILIDGEDVADLDLFDIGRRAGYVFQDPSRQLFCSTVSEEVKFGLKNIGLTEDEAEETAGRYLDMFGIRHLSQRFPGKLSQGEKQRVALAAVLSMGTNYVILDEPTTGLDVRSRRKLGEYLTEIRNSGRGVIIVSHERQFCEKYTDRELRMK